MYGSEGDESGNCREDDWRTPISSDELSVFFRTIDSNLDYELSALLGPKVRFIDSSPAIKRASSKREILRVTFEVKEDVTPTMIFIELDKILDPDIMERRLSTLLRI